MRCQFVQFVQSVRFYRRVVSRTRAVLAHTFHRAAMLKVLFLTRPLRPSRSNSAVSAHVNALPGWLTKLIFEFRQRWLGRAISSKQTLPARGKSGCRKHAAGERSTLASSIYIILKE